MESVQPNIGPDPGKEKASAWFGGRLDLTAELPPALIAVVAVFVFFGILIDRMLPEGPFPPLSRERSRNHSGPAG